MAGAGEPTPANAHAGDCRAILATLPDESVHAVVTSPPYWNLRPDRGHTRRTDLAPTPRKRNANGNSWGLKSKDLVGMPWRVALALQADGWYLRRDVIWSKPNPMPESADL